MENDFLVTFSPCNNYMLKENQLQAPNVVLFTIHHGNKKHVFGCTVELILVLFRLLGLFCICLEEFCWVVQRLFRRTFNTVFDGLGVICLGLLTTLV